MFICLLALFLLSPGPCFAIQYRVQLSLSAFVNEGSLFSLICDFSKPKNIDFSKEFTIKVSKQSISSINIDNSPGTIHSFLTIVWPFSAAGSAKPYISQLQNPRYWTNILIDESFHKRIEFTIKNVKLQDN